MAIQFAPYKSHVVELKRGINENVSSLELEGGELLDVKNYMMAEGGYGGYLSVGGYERIDGAIVPSEYPSQVLVISNCSNDVLEGELLTGDPSTATVTAVGDATIISGSYLESDAIIEVQVIQVGGLLEAGDMITSTLPIGTLTELKVITGCTPDYHEALDYARNLVVEVPGELNILGLHIFRGISYAFRKKALIDEIGMYKEDNGTGWVEIDTSSDPIVYSGSHDFKFSTYNFDSTTDSLSMFWVDGVNQARQYDGTDVVTIDNVGMSDQSLDSPTHLATHNYHLFLAYRGGSLQHSKLGDPEIWDGAVGASEMGLGAEVTNLVAGVSSSLIIFLEDAIRVLHGNSIDDWVLEVFSDTSGAYNKTALRLLGTVFSVGDRGLTTLSAVQEYGDYAANSISQRFKQTLFRNKDKITTCIVNRDLNQYRVYFEDRTGIYVSFEGRELQGATFIEFPNQVSISASGEDLTSTEYTIFATNDGNGFVYRMDSGTNFDGVSIIARMSTAFYHYGSPRQRKGFKRATFEINGSNGQTFDIKVNFDYNELGAPTTIWYTPEIYSVDGDATYAVSKWGTMVYGASLTVTDRVPIYLQGVGTNMSYKIISNEMYRRQHIIQNIITDYAVLGRRV